MNGLRDADHISFSYSSDEDFLPRHITKPTGHNKKPRNDTEEETKPYNGWPGRDLTSDLEVERERRRSDSLSLDQRRRRLCSITPRAPLATPTLTTPPSSTGNSELPRQPVSPGLPQRSSHSPSRKFHSSSLSESQTDSSAPHSKSHSPGPQSRKSHSPIPQSRKTHSPIPQSRKTHSPIPQSRKTHSPIPQSRKTHSPIPQSRKTHSPIPQSRKTHSPIPQSRKTHSPIPQSRKTHSPIPQLKKRQSPIPHSTDHSQWVDDDFSDSDSSSETWQPTGGEVQRRKRREHKESKRKRERERKEGKREKLKNSDSVEPGRPAKMERQTELRESSDEDEQILRQLKRKVQEATEQGKMTSVTESEGEGEKGNDSDEVRKGKSLEEELAITSSSESSDSGKEERESGEVGVGGKARSKRHLLSSSESDSDCPDTRQRPTKPNQHAKRSRSPHKSSDPVPPSSRSEKSTLKRSLPQTTPTSSPVKKLRLVDIDFTGGRMKLPPSRPQPRASPSKSRFNSNRPRMGTQRKLAPVPANASNILKSKPLPRPHPPIKRPSRDKRAPPASKDAVLAAKFPQKRKLLDAPPATRKLKHRHL